MDVILRQIEMGMVVVVDVVEEMVEVPVLVLVLVVRVEVEEEEEEGIIMMISVV
jgi:hypothetical protein